MKSFMNSRGGGRPNHNARISLSRLLRYFSLSGMFIPQRKLLPILRRTGVDCAADVDGGGVVDGGGGGGAIVRKASRRKSAE